MHSVSISSGCYANSCKLGGPLIPGVLMEAIRWVGVTRHVLYCNNIGMFIWFDAYYLFANAACTNITRCFYSCYANSCKLGLSVSVRFLVD